MKIGPIDLNKKILIVAEIGNNHEGDFRLAEEMIGLAAESGADAVKFQTFRTELYVSRCDEERFKRLKSFELTFEAFKRLKAVADRENVQFLSTAFDLQSASFLEGITCAFKIASGDNTFYPLLKHVANTGKPVILSAGLATLEQLKHARDLIWNVWKQKNIIQDLAILHCVCSYPVESRYANLGAIKTIGDTLACTPGYSDHTSGTVAAVLAVAAGARIIEKHFTIDKHYSDFRDHQLSADPEEFRLMVEKIREAEVLMGAGNKTPQECEICNENLVRRSIVARCDIPVGEMLRMDHITWVRPAGGLAPGEEKSILGRTLKRAVGNGEMITPDMLNAIDAI